MAQTLPVERTEASVRPQAPVIRVEGATPVDSQRNSTDHRSASPSRPQPRRERQHSFQGLIRTISRETRTPTVEDKTAKETVKPSSVVKSSSKTSKLSIRRHILHPLEAKPLHSVDIVVVYLFNGAKGDSDLALFEVHEHVEQAEKESSSKRERVEVEREPKSESAVDPGQPASPTRKDGNFLTPPSARDSFTAKDAARIGSATLSKLTPKADPVPSKGKAASPDNLLKSKPLSMLTVNWLRDPTMLPKAIPEARIISVGFDIRDAFDAPIDFEAAAAQLSETLTEVRLNCSTRPILFIGHGYGGIFIEQALVKGACGDENSKPILETTSGAFFFSCPVLGFDETRTLLAKLYEIPADAPLFTSIVTPSAKLRKLTDEFNQKVMREDAHKRNGPADQAEAESHAHKDTAHYGRASRRTGFPIIQYISAEEYPPQRKAERAAENPRLDRPVDRLDDPDSILVLKRDFGSMVKFSAFEDREFQRLTELISWAVHTRQLLDAATGSQEDIESLLENPWVNINLRDRWYVKHLKEQ